MTNTGHIGGRVVHNNLEIESTGHPPGGGTISQTQSLFVREHEALSERNDEGTRLRSGTTSRDGYGLGPPPPPPLALMTDTAWAVAFTINVAITILSAIYFRLNALTVLGAVLRPWVWELSDGLYWLFTCFFVVASAFAASWGLVLASRCMTPLQIALGVYVMVLVAALCILPYALIRPVGLWLPIGCALLLSYLFSRPDRVHFAAANLKVATLAVKSTPQAISWLLCVTAIRYKWLAVGIFASVGSKVALTPVVLPGVIYRDVDCQGPWLMTALSCNCSGGILFECNENGWSFLLLVFWVGSVSWSFDVGASVVAATVADLVSSRWSSTSTDNNVNTTAWQSCRRVLHSSLGSLCKLAAMNCLSRPLHFVAGYLSHANWMVNILMLCLRFTVSYVLLQPLFFVSIYHLDFAEAVRRARAMFRAHGRTVLINDAMLLAGMSFLCLAVAAIPAIVTFLWVMRYLWVSMPSVYAAQMVFVCTLVVIFATLGMVLYALKAVFVRLVQVPESLAENRDGSPHHELCKAWRELHLPPPEIRGPNAEVQV